MNIKIHNAVQGSDEWLALRANYHTASEASAMMGDSPYMTRRQLLDQKKSGITPEIDKHTQKIFDQGHATEAAIRPVVEKLIGEELFPATITNEGYGDLLASLDGATMLMDVLFEHKLLNQKVVEALDTGELGPHHYWQLEQQLLLSEARKVIFVCSDGTEENMYFMWYTSVPKRREALLAGWEQFNKDLAKHEVTAVVEEVEAAPIRGLPEIAYDMDGLSLVSNLDVYKAAADELVERSKKKLETDQDFADCEALCKVFKEAEGKLKAMREAVLGEVEDISTFTKDLDYIGEQIRQARLAGDKQVKKRKEEIKRDIVVEAQKALAVHVQTLNDSIGSSATMPHQSVDFAHAIKGKRNLQSMRDAADEALASAKIDANAVAKQMTDNAAIFAHVAEGQQTLFPDLSDLLLHDCESFKAIVSQRIAEHEAERKEADRQAELEAARQEELAALKEERTEATSAPQFLMDDDAPIGRYDEPPTADLFEMPDSAQSLTRAISDWADNWGLSAKAVAELGEILDKHGALKQAA